MINRREVLLLLYNLVADTDIITWNGDIKLIDLDKLEKNIKEELEKYD